MESWNTYSAGRRLKLSRLEAVLRSRRKGGGSREQCRRNRAEVFRWKAGVLCREVRVRCRKTGLLYSKGGRLKYDAGERLECGAGRLESLQCKEKAGTRCWCKPGVWYIGGRLRYGCRKAGVL